VIEVCSVQSVESAWCGKSQPPGGTLLPVVGARDAWLHPNCWAAMAEGSSRLLKKGLVLL
jgi:hypothetical protein